MTLNIIFVNCISWFIKSFFLYDTFVGSYCASQMDPFKVPSSYIKFHSLLFWLKFKSFFFCLCVCVVLIVDFNLVPRDDIFKLIIFGWPILIPKTGWWPNSFFRIKKSESLDDTDTCNFVKQKENSFSSKHWYNLSFKLLIDRMMLIIKLFFFSKNMLISSKITFFVYI